MRAVEVWEATCDGCGYFGDPQADPEVPDGWEVRQGSDGLEHYCAECAA